MKIKKIISVITMCTLITGTVFSVKAADKSDIGQEADTSSYSNADLFEYAEEVAVLVNKERKANGLKPLRLSPLLSEAALVRAREIPISFSHTRPDGSSCFTAISELNISYKTAAENIAYGQKNPDSVMNAWMNSSGHRSNILNKNVDYIGVGVNYQNGTYYWSQFFVSSDQLYDGSYIPGEAAVVTTTAVTTAAVHTSTTIKNTSQTTIKTTNLTETVTTSVNSNSEKPVTTVKVTENKPDTLPSTTEGFITTVSSLIPDITDSVITTSTTTTTTTNCPVIKPPVITVPLGDNCSGIGIGVIIIKGKN